MKLLITILFFIIGVKINAMNLLDYKVDEKKIILEDWKFFSDQVMGGVSEGKTALKKDKNKFFLRLEGTVSTENNGGFIQVRKEYEIKNDTYKGIRFKARGLESEYYVHVRTKKLFLPKHLLHCFNGRPGARRYRQILSDSKRLKANDFDLVYEAHSALGTHTAQPEARLNAG